ncbi:MAG: class I adenylate-forming enzyme family protein [Acidimicrobiales bacterium]
MTDGFTVGAVIANAARGAPHATAAVIDGRPRSFTDLDQAGTNAAEALLREGGAPGRVALVLAETSFELLAAFVGCARAGIVFAPLNPALDDRTITAVAHNIGADLCLVDETHRDRAELVDAPKVSVAVHPTGEAEPALPEVSGQDGHVAFFTSGSTGLPKAALLSHQTSVLRSHPGSQLEPRGAALCPYPLFHMGGWTIAMQQWHARAPVVFVGDTDPLTLTAALHQHEIERFNAIPALWSRLADHHGDHADTAFPALRFADTGTSPTSAALLSTITAMAPRASVRVFYCSTEAGNVASLHGDDLMTRPGSCGRPGPLTELRIDDHELLVRGPLLFDGYLGDAEASQAAMQNGWYRTGDLARVDEDGFLTITGRAGTVIRTGGEAVTPDVVEAALRTHPSIDEVAVFGVADERWGELVWAAVVAPPSLSLDDIRTHVAADGPHPLARHQHPRRLLWVDTIPRTVATGQIDRHQLRRWALERSEP